MSKPSSGITGLLGSHIAKMAKEGDWKLDGIFNSPANIPSLCLAKDEVGIKLTIDGFRPEIHVDFSAWSHVIACEANLEEHLRIVSLLSWLISSLAS